LKEDEQMSAKLIAKIALSVAVAATVMQANEAHAGGLGVGKVTSYELNVGIPHRGACITLNPPPVSTLSYICVYDYGTGGGSYSIDKTSSNHLYNELNDLFREAFIASRTCSIAFAAISSSEAAIVNATCF
jgi:hypothetical protein